ncbi:unnamed protein product [Symbiodinium natans]|uniref:Uncharacterized protein n=1 Tax=Symbiodinium natans TaxID=878477 RepID=A0A812S193_9DINO|nr:unnamed protein product [Symbiodinium natans]
MELLDKMAIYVLVITPLIMLSKPVLPKVVWGYDFLPQMACHMWSFVIACFILLHSGDEWMALISFAAAMLIALGLCSTCICSLHMDMA